jgi:hypothetical protein
MSNSNQLYYEELIKKHIRSLKNPDVQRKVVCEINAEILTEMKSVMKNSYENRNVCLIEMIGSRGTGKLTSLKEASDFCKVDTFLTIDCRIFNTPDLIMQKIHLACNMDINFEDHCSDDEDKLFPDELRTNIGKSNSNKKEAPIENFWTSIFKETFDKKRVVFYFSHIDRMCNSKRQSFMYSILDNLSMSDTRVVVAFSTSNLFLMDSLERRVKSRFSTIRFYFGTEIESSSNLIQELLTPPEIAGNQNNCTDTKALINHFTNSSANAKLLLFIKFEGSLHKVVQLLLAFFYRISGEKYKEIVCNEAQGNYTFKTAIDFAFKSVGEPDFHRILVSLPYCQQTILKVIKEIMQEKKNNKKFKVLDIMLWLNQKTSKHVHHKFSGEIVLFSVVDLDKLGFIKITKKPISTDSDILFIENSDFLEALKKLE